MMLSYQKVPVAMVLCMHQQQPTHSSYDGRLGGLLKLQAETTLIAGAHDNMHFPPTRWFDCINLVVC